VLALTKEGWPSFSYCTAPRTTSTQKNTVILRASDKVRFWDSGAFYRRCPKNLNVNTEKRLWVALDKGEGVVKRHFFAAMLCGTA
jgi:hypothetical protein